jgi:hypothetical protein
VLVNKRSDAAINKGDEYTPGIKPRMYIEPAMWSSPLSIMNPAKT